MWLLRRVQAVAGVAQARDDVGVLVEHFIHGADDDVDIRVFALHAGDALGAAEHTYEDDATGAAVLEVLDGEAGAAGGGQHGIEQEAGAQGEHDRGGDLGVREDRVEGRLVGAAHGQMPDQRLGQVGQERVEHAVAGAHDGDQGVLLVDDRAVGLGQWRGDEPGSRRQAGRGLRGQHKAQAVELRAELCNAGALVAQPRDSILCDGMREDGNGHGSYLRMKPWQL